MEAEPTQQQPQSAEPVAPEQVDVQKEPTEPEVLDLTPQMEAEKLAKAKAHIKAKEFDDGIEAYAQVLAFKVKTLGELAPETAPLYYDYGDALLRKAESCMDVFGGGGKEEGDGEEGQAAGDDDDLEIAWENLEVAANIYRGCEGKQLELARVLLRLGDVSQASDEFEKSVEDFKECLAIREQYLEPYDRRLADVHFSLANSYGFTGEAEKHLIHMKKSLVCLEACSRRHKADLAALEAGEEDAQGRSKEELVAEIQELGEILQEMSEDVQAEGVSQATVKPAEVKSSTAAAKAPAAANPFDLPSTPAAAGPVRVLEARSKSKRKTPDTVGAPSTTGLEPPAKVPREAAAATAAGTDKLSSRFGNDVSGGNTTIGFGSTTIGF